jgi:NTP pyrophosphatase (non-canonical NTP hydrolase)
MQFNEYQDRAITTAIYPNELKVIYPALGVNGEAGEIAEKVKKAYRDDGGNITPSVRAGLLAEIGDVLWYLAALSRDLGTTLDDAAAGNLEKLQSRANRGVIKGSGDNR